MGEMLGGLDLLDLVYLVLLGIGFVYAVLILLGQGIGEIDAGAPDVDFDAGDVPSFDQGEVGITSISPMSIASFVTAFGASGIIASQLFGASNVASLISALVGGLVVGVIAQLLFIYVFSPQTSSLRSRGDMVGLTAEVIIPIPENGVGQIAAVSRGSRVTYTARTKSGQSFEQGDLVRVVELVGSIAFVEPR
jgi:membrane protein implicated in regulation of membrane protease activity